VNAKNARRRGAMSNDTQESLVVNAELLEMKIRQSAAEVRMGLGIEFREGGSSWWLVCLKKGTMGAWAAPAMWARLAELKEKFSGEKRCIAYW
jgi:hypothetical protein